MTHPTLLTVQLETKEHLVIAAADTVSAVVTAAIIGIAVGPFTIVLVTDTGVPVATIRVATGDFVEESSLMYYRVEEV